MIMGSKGGFCGRNGSALAKRTGRKAGGGGRDASRVSTAA
jgi:hypothetical protein